MSYLISQIFWCLLLAFVLGFLIGWALRHFRCRREVEALEARLAAKPATPPAEPAAAAEPHIPGYPVEDIEGIGEGFGRRLRAEGIDTTDKLLLTLLEADGRQKVCAACDIDEKTAMSWATMADLMRVPGIAGQWSELLWRCDVNDVPSLARQQAAPLLEKMKAVNTEEHRVYELPGEHRVGHWIDEAARMPVILTR